MEDVSQLKTDVDKLSSMLNKFVGVIKSQGDRIAALEDSLESHRTVEGKEETAMERYAVSTKFNRNINAPARAVAFAAHLYYVKQLPAVNITDSGVLTASKMQGLVKWSIQHLADYCEINNVTDIYKDGLDEADWGKLVGDHEMLAGHLARKAQD